MRRILIGLLLAATAAAPALADKGGNGHGGRPKGGGGSGWHQQGGGGGLKGGGWNRGGGGGQQRAAQAQPRADFGRGTGGGWQHQQRFAQQQQPRFEQRGNRHAFAQGPRFDDRGKGKGKARWQNDPRPRQAAVFRGFDDRRDWQRQARFHDKQARKAWKRDLKDERRFQRAFARQDWVPPGHRWDRQPRFARYQQAGWYQPRVNYAPRFVRYAPVAAVPVYYYAQSWSSYQGWNDGGWNSGYAPLGYGYDGYGYDPYAYGDDYYDYAPARYAYDDGDYSPLDGGLLGGGDSMLAALLPVLLQSVMGGSTAFGGLTGYGGDVNVLPLQQASYAPYLGDGNELSSLLLPSVLGNSFF